MDRIMLSVDCPAASMSFDVWVPLGITVKTAAAAIGKGMEELSNRLYTAYNPLLYDKSNRKFLPGAHTLMETPLKNGSMVILL